MFTPIRLLGGLVVGLALGLCATAQPETPEKTVSRHLQAAQEHIEKKEWAAATKLLQQLLDREQDVFVKVKRNDILPVSLKAEATRLLGTLPKEGLTFYE
jgi:hypothetical protein